MFHVRSMGLLGHDFFKSMRRAGQRQGPRAGFFLGDGAGVGKGRQVRGGLPAAVGWGQIQELVQDGPTRVVETSSCILIRAALARGSTCTQIAAVIADCWKRGVRRVVCGCILGCLL